jgi:hypothetical protein
MRSLDLCFFLGRDSLEPVPTYSRSNLVPINGFGLVRAKYKALMSMIILTGSVDSIGLARFKALMLMMMLTGYIGIIDGGIMSLSK